MNIRLEYSLTEGKFRQVQPSEKMDKVKDYELLCCFIEKGRAARFIQAILLKYRELEDLSNRANPPLALLKEELEQFVTEDLQLLEERMNSTYKRRLELLTKNKSRPL